MRIATAARALLVPLGLALLLAAAALASLTIGRYPLAARDLLDFAGAALGGPALAPPRQALLHNLIVQIRLPRVVAAILVGASLSSSGAAFQAVFRNPLVSPGLLGVLGGAAFGAALGILLSLDWGGVELLSFAMGVAAVGLGVGVAAMAGAQGGIVMLVLGGIVSSALFSSLLSMVKYVADPYNQLPTIVYWLMGSLAVVDLHQVGWLAPPIALGVLALCGFGRALDALSMGDDEALSIGIPVRLVRASVILLATLVSALTVSLVGMVGWVGLIVPHIARLLVGPGNARLLPVSALLGGVFLLGADALSRAWTTTEVPIGIVTELIGIPAFLLVLGRARKAWA